MRLIGFCTRAVSAALAFFIPAFAAGRTGRLQPDGVPVRLSRLSAEYASWSAQGNHKQPLGDINRAPRICSCAQSRQPCRSRLAVERPSSSTIGEAGSESRGPALSCPLRPLQRRRPVSGSLADRHHQRAVRDHRLGHVSERRNQLRADASAGHPGRRPARPLLHHPARLRTRLVPADAPWQRDPRPRHEPVDGHALRLVAP